MRGKGLAIVASASIAALSLALAPASAIAESKLVHFSAAPGGKETFFKLGNLKLKGVCTPGGTVEIRPFTKRAKKRAAIFGATAEANPLGLGAEPRYLGVDRFHKRSDGIQLLGPSPGLAAWDNAVGTIVVADKRKVLSIEWLAESGSACLFGGLATVAKVKSDRAFAYRANASASRETVQVNNTEIRAECSGAPGNGDLNVFYKTGQSVNSAYVSSFSDVDSDQTDEFGYSQAEAKSGSEDQLDVSGVEDDHASGTIVEPGSNSRFSTLWVASSSGALGRDCAFAGVETDAGAGDPNRIAYAVFGPSGSVDFFQRKGVILTGSCTAGDLGVEISSSAPTPAVTHWSVISDANLDQADVAEYGEADLLGTTEQPLLSSHDENAIARFVYVAAGPTYVVGNFAADEGGIGGGATCAAAGAAHAGGD